MNKQLVVDFYDAFYNRKDFASAEPLLAEGFVNHHPGVAPGRAATVESFRRQVAEPMPGFNLRILRIAAEEDLVWVWSAVHDGEGDGGGPALGSVVDIWRIEDGCLAEHWDFSAG